MSYNSTPPKITKDMNEQIRKGVNLQLELKKVWDEFRNDKSKAKEVLKAGEELHAIQKSLGINCGGLGPNQVQLRIEYAKDAINKGQDTPTETFKSGGPFKQYINKSGHKVTVLK